jgi:hypothetical protein
VQLFFLVLSIFQVQNFFHDGAVALHTRSEKYGRLERGQFIAVQQSLIKRCKQHFVTLQCGVNVVLGNNGFIWIEEGDVDATLEFRMLMARVRQSIVVLDRMFIPIFPDSIDDVVSISLDMGLSPSDMTKDGNLERITEKAALRQ